MVSEGAPVREIEGLAVGRPHHLLLESFGILPRAVVHQEGSFEKSVGSANVSIVASGTGRSREAAGVSGLAHTPALRHHTKGSAKTM
ncbi:hypothetical protein CITRIK5_20352 [Citricoccus sp. K5]|nr:hypothetical protein CITRIK5_20352 [Citricoccus sp. K5]